MTSLMLFSMNRQSERSPFKNLLKSQNSFFLLIQWPNHGERNIHAQETLLFHEQQTDNQYIKSNNTILYRRVFFGNVNFAVAVTLMSEYVLFSTEQSILCNFFILAMASLGTCAIFWRGAVYGGGTSCERVHRTGLRRAENLFPTSPYCSGSKGLSTLLT